MPSFSISKLTILPGPLRGSAEFLLLSTGPLRNATSSKCSVETHHMHPPTRNDIPYLIGAVNIPRPCSTAYLRRTMPPQYRAAGICCIRKPQEIHDRRTTHYDQQQCQNGSLLQILAEGLPEDPRDAMRSPFRQCCKETCVSATSAGPIVMTGTQHKIKRIFVRMKDANS